MKLAALDLPPRTPVTLRAGVDVPTPPQVSLPWPYTWDRILGQSVTGVLWVAGLTLAAGLIAFLWYRTTVEPSPGFPLQYAPPEGLGPVQMEYIRTESVPKNGLTATLFYLAERRMIELRQVNDEQWNVRGLVDISEWDQVDPVSRKVGIALKVNRPGTEFEAKKTVKSGEKLNKAKTDMAKAVQKWAFDGGLMVKRKKELWVRTANVIALVLGGVRICPLGFPVHHVGPAVRGVLPALRAVLDRRRRHPAHRGRTRIVVAGRRIPPHAGHRLGRDAVRLRCPQGPLHRLHPVRGGRGCRGAVGQEVPGRHGYRCAPTGLVQLVVVHHRLGLCRQLRRWRVLTASSRRYRRRSAPTPHRSRRPAAAAAAVAAVGGGGGGGGGGGEEADHGEIPADLVLVLAVLVLIGFVVGYNKIRAADVRVDEALGGIDVELTRRASLIPSLVHTVADVRHPREGRSSTTSPMRAPR